MRRTRRFDFDFDYRSAIGLPPPGEAETPLADWLGDRRRRRPWRKRLLGDRTASAVSVGIVLLSPLLFIFYVTIGIPFIPLATTIARVRAAERFWRDQARAGRLTDWHMAMRSEEILRAILDSRMQAPVRGVWLLAGLLCALVAAAPFLFGTPFTDIWYLPVFILTIATALRFVIDADRSYTTLTATAGGARLAATRSWGAQGRRASHEYLMGMVSAWLRIGIPLALGAGASLLLAPLIMAPSFAFEHPVFAWFATIAQLIAGLAAFVFFHRSVLKEFLSSAYEDARKTLETHLLDIIESNQADGAPGA